MLSKYDKIDSKQIVYTENNANKQNPSLSYSLTEVENQIYDENQDLDSQNVEQEITSEDLNIPKKFGQK